MTTKEATCKKRLAAHLNSRIDDLRKIFTAYQEGEEDRYSNDIGTFPEYGLSFDYVAPGTFKGQRRGYWRYQLSCGGPSDEFRFFADENFNLVRVEYWFLDWFGGASRRLTRKNLDLLTEIWEFFKEIGSVESEHTRAMQEVS